jgi:hypothetical protein
MLVKRMGILGVGVKKQALNVKMETVTPIAEGSRIWHALYIKRMKLIVIYFVLADFFLGGGCYRRFG